MSPNEKCVPLKGSTKHKMPSATDTGEVPQGEFQVTVMVRRQTALPESGAHAKTKTGERSYLSREKLNTTYGASAAD